MTAIRTLVSGMPLSSLSGCTGCVIVTLFFEVGMEPEWTQPRLGRHSSTSKREVP
jgi:hypothetical protein